MGANPTVLTGGVQEVHYIAPGQWYIAELDPTNPDPEKRFKPTYFDAWLRLGFNSSLTITEHPVETGVQVSDHAYVNFDRFTFELAYTDTTNKNPIAGPDQSRSINGLNNLRKLQKKRTFVQLYAKYDVWDNVLIERVDANDDMTTALASRFSVSMVKVVVADTETVFVSNDRQATNQTNRGQVSPQPLPLTLENLWRMLLTDFASLIGPT